MRRATAGKNFSRVDFFDVTNTYARTLTHRNERGERKENLLAAIISAAYATRAGQIVVYPIP